MFDRAAREASGNEMVARLLSEKSGLIPRFRFFNPRIRRFSFLLRYTHGGMRIRARWIWAGLLAAANLFAQSPVSDARYAHLARGVNLTRWFQYGSRIPITTADLDLLRNAGFTSVRIPVAPQYLISDWSSSARIDRNLAALDKGIDMFLNAGMAVTLDFHADTQYLDYYLTRPEAPESLVDIWKMLAARYANRNPELLFFEIMNEPDNRFTQNSWDAEQQQILAAIHQIAPAHTVILDAVNWSGLDALLQMTPYSDPNVIYALHYYSPSAFTHQGADWTSQPGMASLAGVPWPAFLPELQNAMDRAMSTAALKLMRRYRAEDWDSSRIDWDMRLAAEWSKRWGVRVVVNEFGDFKTYSPPESRVRWLHDVRLSIERYGLPWAMWDYAAGFDLTLRNEGGRSIDPAVGAALGLLPFEPWTGPDPVRTTPLPAFSGLRTVQLGGQPDTTGFAEGILVADVNADGLPDLLVTPIDYPELPGLPGHPVQFFLNSGSGILQPGQFDGPPPMQRSVTSIVAGKFLRSSERPGFFLPDIGLSKLLLPSGAAKLRDATDALPQQTVHMLGAVAGDVDGDGVDDLVTFHDGMHLLRNDGDGHFHEDAEAFPAWASDAVREDNHFACGAFAGRNLLAFGKPGSPSRVFVNDGTGHFADGPVLPAPGSSGGPAIGGCAAVVDLNGDGRPDVIVAWTEPNLIQILMNNGDGTFSDETATRMTPVPASQGGIRRIALARANSGKDWALVVTRVGESPLIKVDRGDGKFVDSAWQPRTGPWVVAPGDFNRDGLLDLVFGRGRGAPVEALFGQTPLQ
jgi:endoglucanase